MVQDFLYDIKAEVITRMLTPEKGCEDHTKFDFDNNEVLNCIIFEADEESVKLGKTSQDDLKHLKDFRGFWKPF